MLAQVNETIFVASFVVYTLVVVAVGLYAARFARQSDEDYFLAGRSLGRWVAALSASASSESGWVTLGLVGVGFRMGLRAYWIVPGCLLGIAFNWFVVAARLRDRAAEIDALTLPDFFAHHFGERRPLLRILSVVVILAAMLLYVAAQFAAAGKAFHASFPQQVSYQTGVLIGAFIVLVYTVSGGFRAVCWTDFLQALLMIIALVVFPIMILVHHGGYAGLAQMVRDADLSRFSFVNTEWQPLNADRLFSIDPATTGIAFLGFLLGASALGINFGYPGQPHVLVRFMALRSRRDAVSAGVISLFWVALVLWGAVTAGLAVKAMTLSGSDWGVSVLGPQGVDQHLAATAAAAADLKQQVAAASERALVVGAIHLLPEILSGMVLAAVLAAICSTADSQLVVAASAAASDVYARLISRKSGSNHVWINRLVVLALGIGAILIVLDEEKQVYTLVLKYGWAILGAAFGPQVILILLWRRATYAGCLAGMLVGFTVPVLWQQYYDASQTGVEIYNLPLGFICALLANIIVSLITKPPAARKPG